MEKSLMIVTIAALCISRAAWAQVGEPDKFSGIYSVVDPLTGSEQNVLKVSQASGAYSFRFQMHDPRKWYPPEKADLIGAGHEYLGRASLPQDPNVEVLFARGTGYLYRVPDGATSRLGSPYTGYLADLHILGFIGSVHRRPLGGTRHGQHYQNRPGKLSLPVHGLNYSAGMVALSVTAPGQPDNAVDTDTLNPYSSSAGACCFYLPAQWHADASIQVEYQLLPDKTVHRKTLPVPDYATPANLWLVMHEHGSLEVVLSDQKTEYSTENPRDASWRGSIKGYPSAPAAYRQQRMAPVQQAEKSEGVIARGNNYWR